MEGDGLKLLLSKNRSMHDEEQIGEKRTHQKRLKSVFILFYTDEFSANTVNHIIP